VGGHEEEGGKERWLVTYADMLTLLLVLFIVLFSISVVNTSKFISLKTSLAAVFGDGTKGMLSGGNGLNENDASGTGQQLVNPGSPVVDNTNPQNNEPSAQPSAETTSGPAGMPLRQATIKTGGYTQQDVNHEVSDYHRIEQRVETALRTKGLQHAVRFSITKRGLIITVITNGLVFPGNSAVLEARGQEILSAVAPSLAADKRNVEVDGYTNQLPVSTGPYPSGWELSSARASAVVRYLVAHRVAERRLSAVGRNDLDPLYPPSDPRAATLNRRVEIAVLSDLPSTAGDDLAAAGSH
jgi:chemotaxis protein MotB